MTTTNRIAKKTETEIANMDLAAAEEYRAAMRQQARDDAHAKYHARKSARI